MRLCAGATCGETTQTAREERIKFLPLDGPRRLLAAPEGIGPQAARDRAMLALTGVHGLRVSEVAGLDLGAGTVRLVGKGSKGRTIYLIVHVPEIADTF